MSFIFDKLAPTPVTKHFKICIKSFFESILEQKTVLEVPKRSIFLILRFARQAMGRYSPRTPLATLLTTALYKH